MNYSELLESLSTQLTKAAVDTAEKQVKTSQATTPREDTTSILLNKIGLEIQRQGG